MLPALVATYSLPLVLSDYSLDSLAFPLLIFNTLSYADPFSYSDCSFSLLSFLSMILPALPVLPPPFPFSFILCSFFSSAFYFSSAFSHFISSSLFSSYSFAISYSLLASSSFSFLFRLARTPITSPLPFLLPHLSIFPYLFLIPNYPLPFLYLVQAVFLIFSLIMLSFHHLLLKLLRFLL